MKRILPIAALSVLLAACTPPRVLPPAASITGYWTGSICKYGQCVNVTARLTLNNTPNMGDFTGKGTLRGLISKDDVLVTGSTATGVLVASEGADTVSCQGTFYDNNKYNGSCQYNGYSAPISLERESD